MLVAISIRLRELAALALIIALVVFVPPFMSFFKLVYISWQQWLICLALSLFPLVAVEISKIFIRLHEKRTKAHAL